MRFDQDAVLGADTTLPVVAVAELEPGAPGWGRAHRRLLRRARVVLAMLRDARVTGQAVVTDRDRPPLSHRRTRVEVTTRTGLVWSVTVDTTSNGTIDGRAVIGVPDTGLGILHFAGIDLDPGDPPHLVREALVSGLGAAIAPQVWLETAADLGVDGRVVVARAEACDDGWMVLTMSSPAGPLMLTVGPEGRVSRMHQHTGSRWVRGEGAFGRFLTAELAEAMGVTDLAQVLEPFMSRLRQQAQRWSGARGPARHLAGRHTA